jgi:hypothetical protein
MDPMPSFLRKSFQTIWAILLAVSVFAHPSHIAGQGLRFEKEKLDFFMERDTVRMTGDYHFANPSPDTVHTTIEYPILVLPAQSFPHSIRITDALDGRPVDHRIDRGGLRFPLSVEPFGWRAIRIEFTQPVTSGRFEYLLTSTASWGSGLKLAEYRIRLPRGCSLKSCSLTVDRTRVENGRVILSIRREDFMPDRNLVFEWKPDNGKPGVSAQEKESE